jgi:hypothetical protein
VQASEPHARIGCGRFMSPEQSSTCTCWRIPDLRGVLQPVGWLMLHDSVVVRLSPANTESGRLRTGRILGAALDVTPGADDGEPYLMLEERVGQYLQIPEQRIVYVEPVACPDPSTLTAVLGLRDDFVASLGSTTAPDAPTLGRFHHGGREYLEVSIRRGLHECAPGRTPP